VEDPFASKKPRGPRATRFLDADAWIDSTLYEARFRLGEFWENVTIFFRRFRATGIARVFAEGASEAVTLGLAGMVVVTAFAIPAFKETDRDWRNLGDIAVTFLDRHGNEIGQRGIIQRDSVPVDEMPDHVLKAVLATEDRRFFEHFGIDFIGLARAMTENVRANSVVQGGSTITQQLAKNLFLTNERSVERKVKEAFLALWLETNLSKREILQLYLDRAYMGGGTFGIAAAADFYFNKNVKDVTLAEAAMLAGLFKAPGNYAPHINLPAARGRANVVLSAMVDSGFVTEGQVLPARLNPATPVDRDMADAPNYFLDWAFEEVRRLARDLPVKAVVARTTIDMGMQKAAEEALEFHLRQHGREFNVTQGALVVMETNGAIRALVGGRDYAQSQFNRATRALRQTGSSFKTYVYTAAMEAGFTPESVVSDGPVTWNGWSPKNYTRGYSGRMTLTTALVKSINTVPVRLARDHLTTKPIRDVAHLMGVESEISTHKTMVLGTSSMTVMDQATAYGTLANGGFAGTRHGITQMMTHGGELVFDHVRNDPPPRRVLSEKTVASMNSILVQIPEWGTARRAALAMTRSAGKTGTTQAYRDAWYVGFTGNYTTSVWMGNDDFSPTKNMTGGSLPAMTWQRLMTYAHQNIEPRPIPGVDKTIPDAVAGASPAGAADGTAGAEIARPTMLSAETTRLLRRLGERFGQAPVLSADPETETLSAL
jgi:penicillin-binding protein 1A